jgi:hypothetical protein
MIMLMIIFLLAKYNTQKLNCFLISSLCSFRFRTFSARLRSHYVPITYRGVLEDSFHASSNQLMRNSPRNITLGFYPATLSMQNNYITAQQTSYVYFNSGLYLQLWLTTIYSQKSGSTLSDVSCMFARDSQREEAVLPR